MLNVIIPLYNGRDTLPQALDSLVAQTRKMFFVTIVNDCDGIDYSDIIEEYTRRGLHINYLQTEKNGGPGMARQYGMDHSGNCDFVMFLDADDMLLPHATEILYKEAKRTNCDIIDSDFYKEHKNIGCQSLIAGEISITWMHGKIYKLSYLREHNIRFLPELFYNEDAYFNLVAWNSTTNRSIVHEFTYLWRDNEQSVTRVNKGKTFQKTGWLYYIKSQICGIYKLYELGGDLNPQLMAATLINMYKYMMRALHDENEAYSDAEKILVEKLRGYEPLMKALKVADFWEYVIEHLNACEELDEGVFFYKERFIDWLNKYIYEVKA